MEKFQMIFTVAVVTFVCMAVWFGGKELFRRWFSNDWCHHKWGMWETKEGNSIQMRFCKKCNMMEKRVP